MKKINVTVTHAIESDSNSVFSMAASLSQSFVVTGKHRHVDFVNLITNPNYVLLILRINGHSQGYIFGYIHYAFYAAENIASIEELYIDEAWRGQHLGTKLINAFETIVIERGVRLISVATRRASTFYIKNGYEPSAEYFRKIFN
ncbi:GNAT family N-acetyltransferase [Methylophaga sp.]|uniref:GNAT family N-acetyltransferase n=1 Tax=Methylophaga sp. TaxID=2024840 RepID=UPI003F6F64DD